MPMTSMICEVIPPSNSPAVTCRIAGAICARSEDFVQLQAQIDEVDAKLMAWHRADECSRRLAKIPGVGPIGAVLLK